MLRLWVERLRAKENCAYDVVIYLCLVFGCNVVRSGNKVLALRLLLLPVLQWTTYCVGAYFYLLQVESIELITTLKQTN